MRSDAALAERFVAGDEAAFDVIYERHRPTVLAVCMGILGAAHDAEDATQETFSSLALALRSHPPNELRPWLTRVARNASIDTTRRRRHRLLTLDGEIPEIPARQSNAAGELDSVLEGIRELPEGQRTALLMRELGGHSYSEIGSFLEIDEDAVRGLIARARVGLRTYREATEMPCASARAAIEAEPDGRRHDKTVRRHLRSCASCRSYRTALRDDAKALRAVFPWQAGGMAGTGLAAGGGAVTAAKSAMVGISISQLAATCAASVCAVGAVGGVVLFNPTHRLATPIHSKAPAKHHQRHAKPVVHHSASAATTAVHTAVETPAATVPASSPVVQASKPYRSTVDGWHRQIPHSHAVTLKSRSRHHQHHWGWQTSGATNGFADGQATGGYHQPPSSSGYGDQHSGYGSQGSGYGHQGSSYYSQGGSWSGDHSGTSGYSGNSQSYGGSSGGSSGNSWQSSSSSYSQSGQSSGGSWSYYGHTATTTSHQTWSSVRTAVHTDVRSGSDGSGQWSHGGQSWGQAGQ